MSYSSNRQARELINVSLMMMFQEIAQLSKQLEESSLRETQLPALQRRIQVKYFVLFYYA